MKIEKIVLFNKQNNEEIVFDKQINNLEDIKLSKELGTENIKNEDSSFLIKSLNDTHISDVIQIRINLTKVGTFLVNFQKDALNEESRKELLDKLTTLKDKQEPTLEIQTKKAAEILKIINEFHPIYVTFLNSKELLIDINQIGKEIEWSFPLIVLSNLQAKKSNVFKSKNFNSDYLFLCLFALINGFSLITGIHEFLLNNNLMFFFFGIALAFTGISIYISYGITVKDNKEKDHKRKIASIIYSSIGVFIGAIVGFFISILVLDGEKVQDNLALIIIVNVLAVIDLLILIIDPISLIINKVKNKK